MRPLRGSVLGCALVALTAGSGPAHAAWNNVFQVCCHHCRSSASYASPISACCPTPCPQQQCTTRYVQRCYYQPVTTYQTSYYYEPVTTYRTSYYYEPVCSYRYSCYYDPCTCSYQQVAQPVTSYRLRSQCCPVTSYLQRCALKPVTTYRQAFYYEPVTTCCTTTIGAPIYGQPPAAATTAPPAVQEQPAVPSAPATPAPPSLPPGVGESREPAAPTTSDSLRYKQYPRTSPPVMQKVPEGSSYRQPPLPAAPTSPSAAPPRVRLERIASLQEYRMRGQVVGNGRAPRAGVQVLFVSYDQQGLRQTTTTDVRGQFRVTLSSGNWLVYVPDAQGRHVFQRKIDVRRDDPQLMTLVSR